MFMFRCRRNALVKRLWRLAAARALKQEQEQHIQEIDQDMLLELQQVTRSSKRPSQWKAETHALLKRLTEDQLEALINAVETGGAYSSACVILDDQVLAKACVLPAHFLLCRIFRWPDLHGTNELKRITTFCSTVDSENDCNLSDCCNPYHWSRLYPSDMPLAPYSRLAVSLERSVGRLVSCPIESLETGGTNQFSSSNASLESSQRTRPWCTLAYWELRQRVGRLFPVTQPSVAIFSDEKYQDGLCLNALAGQKTPETDCVRRTRQKIGLGLLLTKEADGVWLYNRSENPVFVNSPTLDPPGNGPAGAPRTLLVYKVSPGFTIRVFDFERSQFYQQLASPESLRECDLNQMCRTDDCRLLKPIANDSLMRKSEYSDGPFDPNALRISFAKGWGPKYSRQFITSCPCWIEVLLAPCR